MRLIQYTQPATRSLSPLFGQEFNSLNALENEMNRLLAAALGNLPAAARAESAPVDLYEDKNHVYVRAELPGVRREDINVEVVDGYLTLQATRKQKRGEKEESFSISRSVCLSDEIKGANISATYENGVLTVTLPKKEEAKPRKINVSVN